MYRQTRHFPPTSAAWNAAEAHTAIQEIVEDARTALDQKTLWPAHPMDDGLQDGAGNIYFGAAGVIWALDYLHRVGAVTEHHDFSEACTSALTRNAPWYAKAPYPNHASLLMGDLGIQLVAMRLSPSPNLMETILTLAAKNNDLPILELMWGLPGSMLACIHIHTMTNDPRFKALFQTQTARLLTELEDTEQGPIWTQDLYGKHQRFLGPVHGFVGNLLPLIQAWHWLAPEQRETLAEAVPRTLASHSLRSPLGANWPPLVPFDQPATLCQHCHGAPGILTSLADAPFSTPDFETLLHQAGELTWNAGALTKGSNLCHGTGGNGYALLKLHKRTKDPLWLDRARTFAMSAINQVRGARAAFGRGRYSLWTGDPGLAVYLWDCITAEPRFPTIDVF